MNTVERGKPYLQNFKSFTIAQPNLKKDQNLFGFFTQFMLPAVFSVGRFVAVYFRPVASCICAE
jgi:hypothetical protein